MMTNWIIITFSASIGILVHLESYGVAVACLIAFLLVRYPPKE